MQFTPVIPFALALLALGTSLPESTTRPEEGMWLFEALPLAALKEKYDFEPSKEWLDHVRIGSSMCGRRHGVSISPSISPSQECANPQ